MPRLADLRRRLADIGAGAGRVALLSDSVQQVGRGIEALGSRLDTVAARPWTPHGVYLGGHRVLTDTVHGIRMFVDSREMVVTPLLLLQGTWEEPTARTIMSLLRPGMTFVDVGAQMGYFTCLGGRAVQPGGTLYSFEADPALMEILVDNVALNWIFDRAHVENVAVMDAPGTVTLWKRDKYMANSSIGRVSDEDLAGIHDRQTAVDVRAVSLDVRLADEERVDLVKVDVEGAECRVFRGMQGLVQRFPDLQVLAEWSPAQIERTGDDPREFLDFITRNGFGVRLLDETLAEIDLAALGDVSHAMLQLHRPA